MLFCDYQRSDHLMYLAEITFFGGNHEEGAYSLNDANKIQGFITLAIGLTPYFYFLQIISA